MSDAEDEAGWTGIGSLAELPTHKPGWKRAGAEQLAVVRTEETVRALADACPRQSASLAGGRLEGGQAGLPSPHGLAFDLQSAKMRPSVLGIRHFWTGVRDTGVWVFVSLRPSLPC